MLVPKTFLSGCQGWCKLASDSPVLRKRGRQLGLVVLLIAAAVALVGLTAFNAEDTGFRILALGLFFICIIKGAQEGYAFNPYYLFSLTPLSLLLYEYKFSTYYLDRLGSYVYSLALFNIAAFVVGLALIKHRPARAPLNGRELYEQALCYPLLVLGMLPVIYGIVQAPGVLLSGNFLGMSAYTSLMPMSSILMFCRYPALVLAFKSKRRGRVVAVLFCCVLALMLSFNKTNLTFLLFIILFSVHKYYVKSYKSRKYFRISCIAAVILLLSSVTFYDQIRSDFDSTEALVRTGSSGLPKFLMLPYMYLENSWTNLQYVIETQPTHTFGLWLIRPLLFYFRLDGAFSDAYVLSPASSYNTYTYIAIPWKDFGFAGSILVSFGLGLFVSTVYRKFRSSSSPFVTAAYALNAVAVLEMFFSNHFFYLVYPFTACIIALLCEAYSNRLSRRMSEQETLRNGKFDIGLSRKDGHA